MKRLLAVALALIGVTGVSMLQGQTLSTNSYASSWNLYNLQILYPDSPYPSLNIVSISSVWQTSSGVTATGMTAGGWQATFVFPTTAGYLLWFNAAPLSVDGATAMAGLLQGFMNAPGVARPLNVTGMYQPYLWSPYYVASSSTVITTSPVNPLGVQQPPNGGLAGGALVSMRVSDDPASFGTLTLIRADGTQRDFSVLRSDPVLTPWTAATAASLLADVVGHHGVWFDGNAVNSDNYVKIVLGWARWQTF